MEETGKAVGVEIFEQRQEAARPKISGAVFALLRWRCS